MQRRALASQSARQSRQKQVGVLNSAAAALTARRAPNGDRRALRGRLQCWSDAGLRPSRRPSRSHRRAARNRARWRESADRLRISARPERYFLSELRRRSRRTLLRQMRYRGGWRNPTRCQCPTHIGSRLTGEHGGISLLPVRPGHRDHFPGPRSLQPEPVGEIPRVPIHFLQRGAFRLLRRFVAVLVPIPGRRR